LKVEFLDGFARVHGCRVFAFTTTPASSSSKRQLRVVCAFARANGFFSRRPIEDVVGVRIFGVLDAGALGL
jgi:hypothetical protein